MENLKITRIGNTSFVVVKVKVEQLKDTNTLLATSEDIPMLVIEARTIDKALETVLEVIKALLREEQSRCEEVKFDIDYNYNERIAV